MEDYEGAQEIERAWREAETIAKIADDMFVTPAIDDEMKRLRLRKDDH